MKTRKTEVLFFFDTEDFTSPRAADAIRIEAEMLREEGVRGNFNVVGKLCDALRAWGRQDVIDALSYHCIGCHTYGHTLHPDLCERSDLFDFDDAYRGVAEWEDLAYQKLSETFPGKVFPFVCPPGNCDSYAGMYYYADHGALFDAGSCIYTDRSRPISFCNLEHLRYDLSFERFMWHPKWLSGVLDELAERDRVVIYTHPNFAVKCVFWDKVNFDGANLHGDGDYVEAAERMPEETAWMFRQMRTIIRALRDDPRFEVTDMERLAKEKRERPAIRLSDLPRVRAAIGRELAPVGVWSLSDLFLGCVALLHGAEEYRPGKVYGFLSSPYAITESCVLHGSDVRRAALSLDVSRFLPERIAVGNVTVGPADFLRAMLALLTGDEVIKLSPAPQLPSLDPYPGLAAFRLRGTWLHSPDLKDEYLSERLRLQSWTIHDVPGYEKENEQ